MTLTLPLGNGNQFKISLKKIFFPLLLLIVVVIVFFKFSELQEIGRLFKEAKWYWLAAAFLSQVLNYLIQASVYRSAFKILKAKYLGMRFMLKSAVVVYFLNYAIPSLGFAGHIYFFKTLKKRGVNEGRALLIILIELICYYSAFILLLVLSLVYMFFSLGNIGYTQAVAAVGFALLMLGVFFIIKYMLGSKEKSSKRLMWLAAKVDYFEDGKKDESRIQVLLNDFYQDFAWLKNNKKKVVRPFAFQFCKFISDGLTIYFIFLAFGSVVPIGLGVVAFAFGRLFGMISFLPGGLGAFEGAMVLIFNTLGQPIELALSVMLVYRFYSFWLYFPIGLVAYKRLDRKIE